MFAIPGVFVWSTAKGGACHHVAPQLPNNSNLEIGSSGAPRPETKFCYPRTIMLGAYNVGYDGAPKPDTPDSRRLYGYNIYTKMRESPIKT